MQKPCISLEACRVNRRMNQAQWSKEIGVSRNTIANWEGGYSEPSATQLRLISEKSGIPIELIFVPEKSK